MATSALATLLTAGGHANSLGKANEVIALVLNDKSLFNELFQCLFYDDAWVRMRAADALEKICRDHPDWIEPYIPAIQSKLSDTNQQASIKWHIAQIYPQVTLTKPQKEHAFTWLKTQVSTTEVDWIVAANCLKALLIFMERGDITQAALVKFLKVQQHHSSKSVAKKATKMLGELSPK